MPDLLSNLKSIQEFQKVPKVQKMKKLQKMKKIENIQRIQPAHKQRERSFLLVLFWLFLFSCIAPGYGKETTAIIPGNIERVCAYSDFCYYFPPEDFFFHLNDRLLFLEKPDEQIVETGIRKKLLTVTQQYREIKKSFGLIKLGESDGFRLDITLPGGFSRAGQILKPLGLQLEKWPGEPYNITRDSQAVNNEYYSFALLDSLMSQWQKSLNQEHVLDIPVMECTVSLPWDYDFLKEITGLPLDKESFFEMMLGNEHFSLLLATLYRLSPDMIDYISNLPQKTQSKTKLGAWKEIYRDRTFLMGMFILSHALRLDYSNGATDTGKLKLPGGIEAKKFWSNVAGVNSDTAPWEFLHRLAVRDEGRLNYLFLFSSFLEPHIQTALFTGANSLEMSQLYPLISLSKKEKLAEKQFPTFENVNFFTLLYSLRMKNNRFYFPLGASSWEHAVRGKKYIPPSTPCTASDVDVFSLLKTLLTAPRPGSTIGRGIPGCSAMELFITLYSKFSRRPQLLTPEVLLQLFRNYEKSNVLVDFVERIPLRSPETVLKLIAKLKVFNNKNLDRKDRDISLAVFQSLLEILAHTAKYAPQQYDYDALVTMLAQIPFGSTNIYKELFDFFQKGFGLDFTVQKDLIDVILTGVVNQEISIEGSKYLFLIRDAYRKMITDTMATQDVASFSSLLEFNQLFIQLEKEGEKNVKQRNSDLYAELLIRIQQLCDHLPYAEIDSNAPNMIKARVMHYNREDLIQDFETLRNTITLPRPSQALNKIIEKIKLNYLLPHLKDNLMAFVYALNAKQPELRVFLNPNLARLHDFGGIDSAVAWNQCGTPVSSDNFSDYLFIGGLSRMNLALASKWRKYMFNQTFIYNGHQLDSMLVNLMDIYPLSASLDEAKMAGIGALVEQGENSMQRAREDETLRHRVIDALGVVTAGFHYRKSLQYLSRQSDEYPLFTGELRHLGEILSKDTKSSSDTKTSSNSQLDIQADTDQSTLGRFRGIYYHTFGNLVPADIPIFPQPLACFFQDGSLSGEMADEHILKLSYLFFKKKIPAVLMGQVLYSHFIQTAPVLFNQNHPADYDAPYYLYQLISDSRLNGILRYLQKEGYLKLK